MIDRDTEVLTRQGWKKITSCEVMGITGGCAAWGGIKVGEPVAIDARHVQGRFFGFCVEANHVVPAVRYSPHGMKRSNAVKIRACELSKKWVAINTFHTVAPLAENPFIPYIGSNTKATDKDPAVGYRCGGAWCIDDDSQYRLIPDLVKYSRFKSLLSWHGRSYVEDKNSRVMRGTSEFANYSEFVTDQIEVAALGCDLRVERIGLRHLRVHERWNLRVEKVAKIKSFGVSVVGPQEFLLTRYKGKIAIVQLRD